MKQSSSLAVLALVLLTAGCAGVRQTGDTYTAHAESFRILGLRIGPDDHAAAWEMVPEGADVTTVVSSPTDWTSVIGVLTNLLGVTGTQISWKGEAPVIEESTTGDSGTGE